MRPESFPDPSTATVRARPFAADLIGACDRVFAVLADRAVPATTGSLELAVVTLPITIPIDENGVVVLSTGHVDAPRHPGELAVARPPVPPGPDGGVERTRGWGRGRRQEARGAAAAYRAGFALARASGDPLLVPGFRRGQALASLGSLTVAVSDSGLTIVGFDGGGETVALQFDEAAAGLLATALLITVGVKLTKAERGDL